MPRNKQRRTGTGPLRIAAIFVVVFGIGVALGAGLGVWLTKDDSPTASVALIRTQNPLRDPKVIVAEAPRRKLPAASAEPQTPVTAPAHQVDDPSLNAAIMPAAAAIPADSAPTETAPVDSAPASAALPEPDLEKVEPEVVASSALTGWRKYAVTTALSADKPMIAIVLDDLGIDQKRSRNAIELPGPLTLSFIPYGYNLPKLTRLARAAGHELMVHVNMEPLDHDVDPGPNALLTSLKPEELRRRLTWALSRFEGFTGISNHMGSRFTAWPEGMEIVLRALNEHGFLFLDSMTNTHSVGPSLARAFKTPYAVRDVFLDHDRTDAFIQKQLALTERLARRNGHAIAIGHPHDVTVNRLKEWLATIELRGFTLVPVSAIIRAKAAQG